MNDSASKLFTRAQDDLAMVESMATRFLEERNRANALLREFLDADLYPASTTSLAAVSDLKSRARTHLGIPR